MSANKDEILTGLEPYRDPYQIAIGYDQDTKEYEKAQKQIYQELEADIDVGRMDQFHTLQILANGSPEKSFEYLREQVLEE